MESTETTASTLSPDTVIPKSGLSPENAFLHDSMRTPPSVGKLNELDAALNNVAFVLRSIRGIQEATARRRAVLDSAARGNLVELSDGRFAPIKTDIERCTMIEKIFDVDQMFSECTTVFHLALARTVHGMQAIKDENERAINLSMKPH